MFQNAPMFPQLRSRRLIWIALLAWLAQLCLPLAHAAAMAQPEAGLATWCGGFSPAMTQKLATLPIEVREILQKGSSHSAHHQDCVQFCGGATTGGPAYVSPMLALRAAGLEAPAAVMGETPGRQPAPNPPARGPPLIS